MGNIYFKYCHSFRPERPLPAISGNSNCTVQCYNQTHYLIFKLFIMKKLFVLFSLTAVVLMSSCTTDNDESTPSIQNDTVIQTPTTPIAPPTGGDTDKDKDKTKP